MVLRADFAQIQNEVLSRNDFSIRVDHRTLKAQKEEAERNGDTFLARLFSRVPEKYIGIISCQDDDEPKLEWIIVNKVDKKLDRGEKFIFKVIRGKKIDGRMRTIGIVKSVNILEQGKL